MRVVCDLETNGLYNYQEGTGPDTIWCAAAKDIETGLVHEFVPDYLAGVEYLPISVLPDFLDKCEEVIGHNFVSYDKKVLKDVPDYELPVKKITDTLVMSRMHWPKRPQGHSIESYGKQFGRHKPAYEDWTKFTFEMLHRCVEDVEINHLTYDYLKEQLKDFSKQSIRIEHQIAHLMEKQKADGFFLDTEKARKLYDRCRTHADNLQAQIRAVFPERSCQVIDAPVDEGLQVKFTKAEKVAKNSKGAKHLGPFAERYGEPHGSDMIVGPWNAISFEDFDVDSSKQRVERLLELGWKPFEYTDKGQPKITEESLVDDKLPKEARLFGEYLMCRSRERTVKQWLDLEDKNGYVHGTVYSLGTWTHRAAHQNPNMGNIPAVQKGKDKEILKDLEGRFGFDCRDCWTVGHKDHVLVGVDAGGIQTVGLAHYMEDEEYIKVVSDPDIDIHLYNGEKAEIPKRDRAKRFFYSFVLGAGYHKLGTIIGIEEEQKWLEAIASNPNTYWKFNENAKKPKDRFTKVPALEHIKNGLKRQVIPANNFNLALAGRGMVAKETFIEAVPGLQYLNKELIPKIHKDGWFEAIDGRQIKVLSKHTVLAVMLQSYETIVMRLGMILYQKELTKLGIWFKQRSWVHDEYQIECHKKDAEALKSVVEKNIVKAADLLGSKCPLSAEGKIGMSWSFTH